MNILTLDRAIEAWRSIPETIRVQIYQALQTDSYRRWQECARWCARDSEKEAEVMQACAAFQNAVSILAGIAESEGPR